MGTGYTVTDQSHYDYAVTQVMIWEQLGDQYISSTTQIIINVNPKSWL